MTQTTVKKDSLRKRAFALLQKTGKSLLFPIAMLPIAAIFLRIGVAIPANTDLKNGALAPEFSVFISQLFQAIGNGVFG